MFPRRDMSVVVIAALLGGSVAWPSEARTVSVKYRGEISVDAMDCQAVDQSSLVFEVCYSPDDQYMLTDLKGTWYHYCLVDPATVASFRVAQSMGKFFNQNIKGRFDCRVPGALPEDR